MSSRSAARRVAIVVLAALLGPLVGLGTASPVGLREFTKYWDPQADAGGLSMWGPRDRKPGVAFPARGVDMIVEDTCGEGAVAYTDGLVCLGLVDGLNVSGGGAPLKAANDEPDLVPEPATVSLLLTGMGLLVARRRRTRQGSR
jgi:hypothetical protein